jgi:diguanylate cyclase (GGDEF)-like protein
MVSFRILFLIVIITCMLMAVSLWVSSHSKHRRAFIKWTLVLVLAAISFGIYAAYDLLPAFFTTSIAPTILMAALMLSAVAILDFQGRARPFWQFVVAPVVVLAVNAALADQPNLRMVFSSIAFTGVLAWLVLLVLPGARKDRYRAYRLLIGGAGVCAIIVAARCAIAIAVATTTHTEPSADSNWFWLMTVLAAFTSLVTSTLAFILLHHERADREVRELAMTDSLTGIYNRRTFFDLADAEFARARRLQSPLTMLMIDIDRFKRINDVHGHQAGDQVLVHVVGIIKECLRAEDLFVRYGGEEFCVLVSGAGESEAHALAERIRMVVESSPARHKNKLIALSASVGVATLIPTDANNVGSLISLADAALYEAKNAGRNCVRVANAD